MIGPGVINLNREQKSEYGAQCQAAISAALAQHDKKVKRGKHWEPPRHINFDEMEVSHPAISRFFCAQEKNNKFNNIFLQREENREKHSALELAQIQHEANELNVEHHWRKFAREARPNRAGDTRLVSTCKSPTKDKSVNKRPPVARFYTRSWSDEYRISIESFVRQGDAPPPQLGTRYTDQLTTKAVRNIIDSGAYMAACKGGYKTFLTLTFNKEQREALKVHCIEGEPGKEGDIVAGAVAAGPFTRVEFEPKTTIGREVSRFMDALQKKYTRGWTWKPTKEQSENMLDVWEKKKFEPVYVGVKHTSKGPKPIAKKINYVWVAESPTRLKPFVNHVGETVLKKDTNPHVHMLLDWGVERLYFDNWAAQIEKLWGMGFATLEKIKQSKAASDYLLKALGYMTKGAQHVDKRTGELFNDQGRIIGNRYNISSGARAPAWECIGEYDAQIMARFVADIGQKIQAKQESIKAALTHARASKKDAVKTLAKTRNNKKMPVHVMMQRIKEMQSKIERIEHGVKKLTETRYKQAYANKYKITFRAKEQLSAFVERAISQANWAAEHISYSKTRFKDVVETVKDWAKEKSEALAGAITQERQQQEQWWKQVFKDPLPPEPEQLILV